MGLKQRAAQRKYVRIKDGKFYLNTDLENGYEELEGLVVGLSYKDEEYNGAPIRKLIVLINDEDDIYHLGLNVETNSYSSLVNFLSNVDLAKPVTFHPKEETLKKEGSADVQRKTILVSQNGKFAKSYFTKDDPKGLPSWDSILVGRKKVLDKTKYLDFLEEYVKDVLAPQAQENDRDAGEDSSVASKPQPKQAAVIEEEEDAFPISDDKLPWE